MILKYSDEKEKMIEYLRKEENREVEEEIAKVIEVITKIPMNVTQEGGKVDMCKATEEYAKECREKEKIDTARRMLEEGSFTMEMIEMITGLSGQAIHELKSKTLTEA